MPRTCSVARTLDVVGERWSCLVLREVFLGVRRFESIREATGAPRAVLADRLRSLVDAGILRQRDYREPGSRVRQEYLPTDAGRDLQPVLIALMQWGDRYLAGSDGPPVDLSHAGCGGSVRAVLTCEHGHVLPDTGAGLRSVQRLPAAADRG